MDGNIDHPLVTGVVYNGLHRPPWELPGQHALSGWRSRELKGGPRGNQLLLDDTAGQLQAQLRSDHLHSQLALGHIVRVEDNAGRKEARGEGWELRTDGHGVARAAGGLLLTTEARAGAAGSMKDMDETALRLVSAAEQHRRRAAEAHHQGALDSHAQQGAVADAVAAQGDAVRGRGGATFPELSEPHLVLASPAGIVATAAKSMHLASGEHTALTSGGSLSIAAGDGFFASVRETFRLFVRNAGMKLIAASGKVTIEARSDDIEAVAHKVLSLISQSDWVDIRGRKGVRLHGGDSMIEISDKVQFYTSAPTLFHGNLETRGPKHKPQPEPGKPVPPTTEQLHHVVQAAPGGKVYANMAYTLYKGDAKVEDGVTDEFGRIVVEHERGAPRYRVLLPDGEEFLLRVADRFPERGGKESEQARSSQGFRALDDTPEGRWHQ